MSTQFEPHPQQVQQAHHNNETMSNLTHNTATGNGNGVDEFKQPHMNGASAHSEGYRGGGNVGRFITPGGNPIDTTQPAFPVFHRR
jgi:hypothetical protein